MVEGGGRVRKASQRFQDAKASELYVQQQKTEQAKPKRSGKKLTANKLEKKSKQEVVLYVGKEVYTTPKKQVADTKPNTASGTKTQQKAGRQKADNGQTSYLERIGFSFTVPTAETKMESKVEPEARALSSSVSGPITAAPVPGSTTERSVSALTKKRKKASVPTLSKEEAKLKRLKKKHPELADVDQSFIDMTDVSSKRKELKVLRKAYSPVSAHTSPKDILLMCLFLYIVCCNCRGTLETWRNKWLLIGTTRTTKTAKPYRNGGRVPWTPLKWCMKTELCKVV